MKTEHFQVRVGWPKLTTAVQEVATILNSDDWARHSSEDDKKVYYILGMKAWTADREGRQNFETLSVPTRQAISPFRESEVHGKVAATRSPSYYVNQARARLEGTGVDPEAINTFLQGMRGADVNWASLAGKFGSPGTESFAAFGALIEALVMEKGLEPEDVSSEAEQRHELDIAIQKVYLRELAGLYRSIVGRATSLETLNFSDAQLNEASRCFIYGFFRATILLSASAVETQLRTAVGQNALTEIQRLLSFDSDRRERGFFNLLVDEAESKGFLGERSRMGQEPPLVAYSRRIFKERNKIAHEGVTPTVEMAEEILINARQAIEFVRQRLA